VVCPQYRWVVLRFPRPDRRFYENKPGRIFVPVFGHIILFNPVVPAFWFERDS
jgi:hypothetical protein